jgi:5-methylcytosine-specific restriction endonuclease McrA
MELEEIESRIRAYKLGIDSTWQKHIKNEFSIDSFEHQEFLDGYDASKRNDPKRNQRLRSLRIKAAKLRGKHSKNEWNELVDEFEHCCVRCLEFSEKLEKDHIIPIYQGGSDGIENLQPLCKKCNTAKGPENINWVSKRREERGANQALQTTSASARRLS